MGRFERIRSSPGGAAGRMLSRRTSSVDNELCREPIIMPMQAESLEVLESAAVAPAQARAIVRAIEIEIAGAKDTLATKHDLVLMRQDFHTETEKLRREMVELASTLRMEMAELRAELRAELAAGLAALRGEMGALKGEMTALKGEMTALKGEMTGRIEAAVSGVVRQLYLAILGQMAVLLGFSYFFATHVR
jgi:hypothetical protein